MKVLPFERLLRRVLAELEQNGSIFGIHRSLFYSPKPDVPYTCEGLFGHHLATPIGPAAGPHTQLAQNILCAWLSGGRFIELKTVQIMDELEIPRPCIDMEDEGYNVEWSQELKLEQSAREYVNAWAMIPILRRLLGHEGVVPFGTIFNMSVGYNLEGIQSPPMVRFMDQMEDAAEALAEVRTVLQSRFPQYADIEIPQRLSNSVTLSTMHGCPPDEIEQICHYLLAERRLHTYVKLNPTLLGKEAVLRILHDDLGYREIQIPDSVFEHDLQYKRAVALIASLKEVAAERGLTFGVKLSNTLAMANHRDTLPGDEMYMSGRALYPVTVNLFRKLVQEFNGDLNVSYSAGSDALNVATLVRAGALPVTAASDLLKPGGYPRFVQWLDNLEAEMRQLGASNLDEFTRDRLSGLEQAAIDALQAPRYKKSYFPYGLPKVTSGLDLFDCVVAPCKEPCAVHQDVPEYAWLIAQGEYDRALEVILSRNPLPGVTGYVCTELCRTRCTRNDYDQPVAIRALKRFAQEYGQVERLRPESTITDKRVAIVGGGPSGLSAAFFLALNGVRVTIFEAKDDPGGMMRLVPPFRLPTEIIQKDVDRIRALGVEIRTGSPVAGPPEALLADGFDAVYVSCGFQADTSLRIEGLEGEEEPLPGVFAALDLLERVRRGERVDLGSRALVIGGGDTALDAARIARRLTGNSVTVVYRRSEVEMPAHEEEKEGAFEEDIILFELATPIRAISSGGRFASLECLRNRLGEPAEDGRRRPIPIEGSEFKFHADSLIVAIGQSPDIAFLDGSGVALHKHGALQADSQTGATCVSGIYAGGDVVDGPESIIAASADGRRAAEAICAQFGIAFTPLPASPASPSEREILEVKGARARKEVQYEAEKIPPRQRLGFELIESTLSKEAAWREALRCLQCSTFCDKCVEVCPNRANATYLIRPTALRVPQLSCEDGRLVACGSEAFEVRQERQIIHISDFCNACGNCATFCVHQGRPYLDKPRLFLDKDDYQAEQDNAYHIEGNTIQCREAGLDSSLVVDEDLLRFENKQVRIEFSPDMRILKMELKEPFDEALSLRKAAEMAVIYGGLARSAPFLLI
jgi:putative selenate reductase